jgi:hypothetical protein
LFDDRLCEGGCRLSYLGARPGRRPFGVHEGDPFCEVSPHAIWGCPRRRATPCR